LGLVGPVEPFSALGIVSPSKAVSVLGAEASNCYSSAAGSVEPGLIFFFSEPPLMSIYLRGTSTIARVSSPNNIL